MQTICHLMKTYNHMNNNAIFGKKIEVSQNNEFVDVKRRGMEWGCRCYMIPARKPMKRSSSKWTSRPLAVDRGKEKGLKAAVVLTRGIRLCLVSRHGSVPLSPGCRETTRLHSRNASTSMIDVIPKTLSDSARHSRDESSLWIKRIVGLLKRLAMCR